MTYENPYMKGRTWPELNILETLRHRNPLVICITMMWYVPLRPMVY